MDENKKVQVVEKGNKTLMGVLAYIGILVLIPLFMEKKDSFVKFHIKQGLVLLIIEIALYIVYRMFFWSFFTFTIMPLLNLAIIILAILGIINVVQKKERALPFVGQFAKYFSF